MVRKKRDETTKVVGIFERAGLVKLSEEQHSEESSAAFLGTTIRTWTTVTVSLTDESKKYLIEETPNSYKVKIWETDIDNVSGIQEKENEKAAVVEYTISNKNITPFGEQFNDKNNIQNKTSYFSKYDDGWRLKN